MPLQHIEKQELAQLARHFRIEILKMLTASGSGHPGGSLSAIDILTVLYFKTMNYRRDNPRWKDRDRFILSKGHACPALYVVLAELGWVPKEELGKLRKLDGQLQGHPDMLRTTGIEISTGSLGQGLSAGNGMALAMKLDGRKSKMFVMLGDGETQEGMVWEAAMSSAHYKLDNLCAIVDNNGLQIDGEVDRVMKVDPLEDKFKAFGWFAKTIDGHDLDAISEGFEWAAGNSGAPSALIAKTVKGKGVSFMENQVKFHGVTPTTEELERALEELK